MGLIIKILSLVICCFWLHSASAQQLVTGLTNETVFITSDFTGTELVIFGTINDMQKPAGDSGEEITVGRYDVVIVMEGPKEPGVVRKKERAVGIWINKEHVEFGDIPSSYLMQASADMDKPGFDDALKTLQVGFKYMQMGEVSNITTQGEVHDFREAVIRLKMTNGLYRQNVGVEFLGDNLFRARIKIPALVPVGIHQVRSYLLFDNQLVSGSTHAINIRKTGFEQATFSFSRNYSFLYGIICVVIAMFTGWLSSVIFRRD